MKAEKNNISLTRANADGTSVFFHSKVARVYELFPGFCTN